MALAPRHGSDLVREARVDTNDTSLAGHLTSLVIESLEEFFARYAPDLTLPATIGAHLVGTDAIADLAYTLGWLHEAGVSEVAGRPLPDVIVRTLEQIDGPETHSFFSYRVAETLNRFGSFDHNQLLSAMTTDRVENLRIACDSTELVPLLDGLLPRNYAAVLARCEMARRQLGILDDETLLSELVDRTRSLITANEHGYLDESHEGLGCFDIYAADVYLFCEPLASVLGEAWISGTRNVVELVESIAMRDGSAFSWGRSTGALSIALTVELGALVARHSVGPTPLSNEPDRWSALAANAADQLGGWFSDGLVTAHQHRSPEDYRGPKRRLQMTFDLLGKLAYSAVTFAAAPNSRTQPRVELFPTRDELIPFSDRAAVWTYRDERVAFAMPFVSGRSSDYLPSPHNPSMFETPVDSTLAGFVPVAHRAGSAISPQQWFAPGETPTRMERTERGLEVDHEQFVGTRPVDGTGARTELDGDRRAIHRVRNGMLEVDEHLAFATAPTAITIIVPSTHARPLKVEVAPGSHPHRVRTVPVDGMAEWSSAWGSFDTVTEIEIEPAEEIALTWRVGPASRVAVTLNDHHYVRTVYDPVVTRLSERAYRSPGQPADVMHLHWPEWAFGFLRSVDEHARIADELRSAGTRIVWTQHNLSPHLDEPEIYDPIYQVWADACDAAIHHSEWGRRMVTERYRFDPACRHEVIPHPHFGPLLTPNAFLDRDEAARRLGLQHRDGPAIRIGVIGAPRKEKDLRLVADAVARSDRDDIELVIWSSSFSEDLPTDPRITAHVYESVDRSVYDLRLAACDAIALPFTTHTMLGTGTTADLVATGTAGLATDWPYLHESLGGGAIAMGTSVDEWTAAIDRLDADTLRLAGAGARAQRTMCEPTTVARRTAELIESLGVTPP